jgi:hypothetical protein
VRLILIFILLSGCARDFDINPTTTIVRQLFKASYDETRVKTLAKTEEKYTQNSMD